MTSPQAVEALATAVQPATPPVPQARIQINVQDAILRNMAREYDLPLLVPGHLKELKSLGQGGFGEVKLYANPDGNLFAIKEPKWFYGGQDIALIQEEQREVKNEINLLCACLPCPYITRIRAKAASLTLSRFWIIQDYYNQGSLNTFCRKVLRRMHRGKVMTLLHLFEGVRKGIEFLHDSWIIHNDIKPDNILVESTPGPRQTLQLRARIGDLGLAKYASEDGTVEQYGGTEGFMAPEMIQGRNSFPADLFAFGVSCDEIIREYIPGCEVNVPSHITVLVNQCQDQTPTNRPGIKTFRFRDRCMYGRLCCLPQCECVENLQRERPPPPPPPPRQQRNQQIGRPIVRPPTPPPPDVRPARIVGPAEWLDFAPARIGRPAEWLDFAPARVVGPAEWLDFAPARVVGPAEWLDITST
jgi:serine/threonine protein kinase